MAQINDYVPQNGLVLYLPFNNSYTDLSPTNVDVDVHGGTFSSDQFGNPNSVYTCTQEQNLEISTADYPELQPDGDFSIALWVHYTGVYLSYDNIHYPTFVECGTEYFLRYFEYPNSNVKVQGGYLTNANQYTGAEYLIKDQFVLSYPGWTHVVYTVKTNGSQKLFINGVLQSTVPSVGTIKNVLNSMVKIGGIKSTNLSERKRFAGSFDDIAIYNRELSTAEAQQLYNGYLDKYRGKEAYLTFNGASNGNYVEIATPLNLNSNRVIIEAMVYFPSGGGTEANDGIIVSRDGNTTAGIIVNNLVGNGVRLGYMWNGAHYDWAGGPTVTFDEWHSIRLIITPTTAILMANSTSTSNAVAHAPEEFDGKLLLGYDGFSTERRFKGRMDEVRIWNNPTTDDLNHALVGNRHNCPFRGEYYPSLVAYYNFNVGDDIANNIVPTTLKDVLGLRDGTLKQYNIPTSNPWSYGGPVVNIDIAVTTDPLTPGVLTAVEKNASSYQWFKVGEIFPEYQDGATNRSFSATSDGTYFVRLTKHSCVLNSDSVLFNSTVTALDDQAHLSDIQFYPNPSKGLVTLTKDVDGVKVYSTQGQLLLQSNGKEIDLRNLSKGSYILKIENKQVTSTHKLILE